MLQKNSIKIEFAADCKPIDLRGVSTEDALKLIEAANSLRVSHLEKRGAKMQNPLLLVQSNEKLLIVDRKRLR